MRADRLNLDDLIEFEPGSIHLHGRRFALHSIHAFGLLRKDIVEMVGPDQARRLFTRFGYAWGRADAAALHRTFTWDSTEEWLKAGVQLHALQGLVQPEIQQLRFNREKGTFAMTCDWKDSGEAEEHQLEIGQSDQPVCWELTGYASGYASYVMGKPVYFVETACQGKGNRLCTVVGKDVDSWGNEIMPHLPFFDAAGLGDLGDIKARFDQPRPAKSPDSESERSPGREVNRSHQFVEGRSRSIRQVLDLAGRVAPFDTSVLVIGETGVGKEVLAHHLHALSHRAAGPFLAVNCGALPETLLESELFGHRRGSFTGAIKDRAGLFKEADGGTVFLDEIGDITPATQLKILRVLQEKEITRVGDNQPRKIDVRVVAATNRDLEAEVAAGRFREDLLYRLRVVEIEIPPLRERREDILPLARFLLERISDRLGMEPLRLDGDCADYLVTYDWPGNVRELENALERAAVLSTEGVVLPDFLPQRVRRGRAGAAVMDALSGTLKEVEQNYIERVLESTGGNKTRAAKILGIGQATLWRKLKNRDSTSD
ncbi:AAA domain-containing protein [candidate division GN15 bacterium]|nr:AAA domain-containing protein [candidate division GN15 bacterium]